MLPYPLFPVPPPPFFQPFHFYANSKHARERERERERQRQRQTDRQTDRQIQNQTATEGQTEEPTEIAGQTKLNDRENKVSNEPEGLIPDVD